METRKSLLFSAGMVAIVALLAATNAFAQSSCNSETTTHAAGNFIVNVAQTTFNGLRSYKYTMTNAPGKSGNPNKFFVYVKDGLEPDLGSSICDPGLTNCSPGVYVDHNEFSSSTPPPEVWRVNRHEDGVVFPSVAINRVITVNVPERFKPEEAVTTIVIGIGSTYEHCGPIFGPTTPAAPAFEGSPVVSNNPRLCFANGCCYFATVGLTDGVIRSLVGDPATPFETNPPTATACVANNTADCAADLAIPFCGIANISAPIQSLPGGTCYYPNNIKFPC